ncbi:MAG: c(7)-type cytochrome triheme domain-containing protein [Vicinamibacterales bacterium]
MGTQRHQAFDTPGATCGRPRCRGRWTARLILAMLVTLVAIAASAGSEIRKMPADRTMVQAPGSPGIVTFNHSTHVDQEKPDCTSCHPRLFSILGRAEGAHRVTHAQMEKGAQCGACHGKRAFNFDDCTGCHR